MRRVDSSPHRELVAAVRDALARHADPARAVDQQRYMKSAMPYRGLVTADVRRLVAAELVRPEHQLGSRGQWIATMLELWDGATHREERYAALALARHRTSRPFRTTAMLSVTHHFVVTGAWWDLVDETATHLLRDDLLRDRAGVEPTVRAWSVDPDLWLRRAAIICQVGVLDRVDLDLLAAVVVPNLEHAGTAGPDGKQDFFIRKGIGWALRDAARRHPGWVAAFVGEHREHMAGLTVREATKHLSV